MSGAGASAWARPPASIWTRRCRAWRLPRPGKRRDSISPGSEGDTISVAIGQGYNLTTPIQMARVVAAIANGGIVYKPYIVEKVESPAGEVLYQAKPEVQSRLGASPATLEAVRQVPGGGGQRRHGQGRPPA